MMLEKLPKWDVIKISHTQEKAKVIFISDKMYYKEFFQTNFLR